MPLRIVQEAHEETVAEMYLAADARYAEGLILHRAGQHDAAIYLWGYTAEILLKLAYCRLEPSFQISDIAATRFGPLHTLWRSLFPGSRLDLHDLHSLAFLLEYEYQQRHGHAYRLIVAMPFYHCIDRLQGNWWVSSRYRHTRADAREAEETQEDVEWLYTHHMALWR